MEQLVSVLVTVLLVVMMATIGLRVSLKDLIGTARNGRLMLLAVLANYVCVPAVTVALLLLFGSEPIVAAGFLILAVCPGAPFAPSCVALARGNVPAAVGLMVLLAGSSAIVAPLLLKLLLPLLGGDSSLEIDALRIVRALFITQLLPLCAGLALRHWRPAVADRLQRPADLLSAVLSLLTIGVILSAHFDLLLEIPLRAYLGMAALLVASWLAGWLLGGTGHDNRRAMAITTALRNVGVALMIATDRFAGTAAVTATVAYGLFEIFGTLLLALWWSRTAPLPASGDVRGSSAREP